MFLKNRFFPISDNKVLTYLMDKLILILSNPPPPVKPYFWLYSILLFLAKTSKF